MYGFSKNAGVPQDDYLHKLHTPQMPKDWLAKEIADLSNIANIQFVVVDAIMCLDLKKSVQSGGENQIRMNTIIASADPVAADHVCARLMGMNPDDVEHITLAERTGLGTNDPNSIHIYGADLELTKKRFRKTTSRGSFGQSNRTWLLCGPFFLSRFVTEPIDYPYLADEGDLAPLEAQDDWSESVYFMDDHIDLKDYFELSSSDDCIAYAFAYFDAPEDQTAELWIGSDEALKVYINGDMVYRYNGTRSFSGSTFVNSKVDVQIQKGENRLLVKALQKYGRYDFCLNICEPESNTNYDGNRVWGLKFRTALSESISDQPLDQ
jgi:hypothetical protein